MQFRRVYEFTLPNFLIIRLKKLWFVKIFDVALITEWFRVHLTGGYIFVHTYLTVTAWDMYLTSMTILNGLIHCMWGVFMQNEMPLYNRHEKALPMYVTVSVGVWGLQRQVLPESNPRLNNAVSQFPQTGSFEASLQVHLDRFVVLSVIVIHRSRGESNDYSNILHISHARESVRSWRILQELSSEPTLTSSSFS